MKGIDKKLDDHWKRIVKARAGRMCERCKVPVRNLNAHHVIGRRNKAVRWELSNGVALCPSCHVFSSSFSAHQTPTLFTLWIIAQRSEEWHDTLMKLTYVSKRWTKAEKEELLAEFKLCLEGDDNG